jgi:hypothetical protein
MKLKRIIEQAESAAQYYDLGKDFSAFTRSMDTTSEQVKAKFEQAIGAKLNGKKIRARASRGYKQFEKDYEIDVTTISLDDYYDNYVVVAKGANGKEYFLKPGFKVQILGAAEESKPEQPPQPPPQPQQTPQPPQPPPSQQAPTQPEEPVNKESKLRPGETEIVKKYTVQEIMDDVKDWLPKLLADRHANLKNYIPQDGIKRTVKTQSSVVYGITIPFNDSPGLTTEMIKKVLAEASGRKGDLSVIYVLEKFETRGGKFVIIVKKLFNY